ncbi:GNAT family N-acetyltransferase [Chloroflexota bacterium]
MFCEFTRESSPFFGPLSYTPLFSQEKVSFGFSGSDRRGRGEGKKQAAGHGQIFEGGCPMLYNGFNPVIFRRKTMPEIEYSVTDERDLDLIGGLWQKLHDYHVVRSEHFARKIDRITFDFRKGEMLDRAKQGRLRIDLAGDRDTGKIIGYCIGAIYGNNRGEIESIYIEEDYRRSGIGDTLMKKALDWMDENSVNEKIIEVGGGNEEVFDFYSRFGFYPGHTILGQVEE